MKLFRRYGIWGGLKLLFSLIYTKLFFPKARLIRLPFDIRNKHLIRIGKGFTSGFNCRIEAMPPNKENVDKKLLLIGDNVQINDYVHIAAGEKVVIGHNVLIASKVFISDINHGNYGEINPDSPLVPPNERELHTKQVIVEDNVWIGESVCILGGVTIGRGSIIGALSTVSRSIPPYSIAVGSPAKVVKIYDFSLEKWVRKAD